jgi:quinol monooxygenase YgiN
MSDRVKISAILTARPGQEAALPALLEAMAPHCRAEAGNLRWDVWRDQAHAARYVIDELYRDPDAVAAHRAAPYYQDYLARIPDLAERIAVTSDPFLVAPAA